MEENLLIITVGLPYSGKSTWAKNEARNHGTPIVNPDSIRLMLHGKRFYPDAEMFVWSIADIMVRSLFKAGNKTVILDATNTTPKRRDQWYSKNWRTETKVFRTHPDTCIERAERANDATIIPIIGRMTKDCDFTFDKHEERRKSDDNT